MMGWYRDGGFGGEWIMMGLGMLLFWGVVALVVVALVRWVGQPGRGQSQGHDAGPSVSAPAASAGPAPSPAAPSGALQILDERFARGDITEEEYLRRRDVLLGR